MIRATVRIYSAGTGAE